MLRLCLAIVVFVAFTFTQPPGGYFSNCCNGTTTFCNYYPVDHRFVPKTCDFSYFDTGISCATRNYFMLQALEFTLNIQDSLCPFNPFGAIMVNHTKGPNIEDAQVVCFGLNKFAAVSPFWHAEIDLLINCSNYIINTFGINNLDNDVLWQQLSMYTTAESCSQCMSSSRWNKVGEVIWAVSDPEEDSDNWNQIEIRSAAVQQASNKCIFGGTTPSGQPTSFQTRLITFVEEDTLLPYFGWQFNPSAPCPTGCSRFDGFCVPS